MSLGTLRLWQKRLLVLLVAFVAALGLGEGLARLIIPEYAPRDGGPRVIPSGSPVFWLVPSQEFEFVWDRDPYGNLPEGARMTVRVDADGFRNAPAVRGTTPPDVLFVGDSFVFGEGVEVGRRFTDRIADGSAGGGAGPLGVVNAGVPGFSILDDASGLPVVMRRYKPRAIIVVLGPNDLVSVPEAQRRAQEDLLILGSTGGLSLRLLVPLRAALATRAAETWYMSYWTGDESARWHAARPLLTEMRKHCDAAGVHLGVAMFPLLHRLDGDYPFEPAHELVMAACAADGIPALDLLDAFRGREPADLWVHPADHHPDADAHRIAAEALAPFVAHVLAR